MLEDLLALLSQRLALVEQAGDDFGLFVSRLWHYVRHLRNDPRTAAVLDDLTREAEEAEAGRRASYVAHVQTASDILDRIEALDTTMFAGPEPDQMGPEWFASHYRVRRLAQLAPASDERVEELSAQLPISVARRYLTESRVPTESELHDEVAALDRSDQLARRAWNMSSLEPARAYSTLARVLNPLDPVWAASATFFDEVEPEAHVVATWADGGGQGRGMGSGIAPNRVVSMLRDAVRLLDVEVRARLGDVRSKLALFRRFKTRCEWYERERLLELAAGVSSSAENRLSEKLALYLFDQGLNPLIRPRIGNKEPDLLDPSPQGRIYVEAKQYTSSKGSRKAIQTGARQIWEMLATLHGSGYEVHEAFFPVFRRGGPIYALPESLRHAGCVMYPMLINIASSIDSGSQLKANAIVIPNDDLLPEVARLRRARSPRGRSRR